MENKIPSYLLQTDEYDKIVSLKAKRSKFSFIDKTIMNSAKAVKSIYLQEDNAIKENYIHKLNPHIKLISLIYFAVIISIASSLKAQILTTSFIFLLYIISGLKIFEVYKKIIFLAFVFGFLVVFPASLNLISPGKIIYNIISFEKSSHFLIYNIPQHIGFTSEGIQVVLLVFLRVLNSISFAMLIVYTTSFPVLVKSFKIIGIPDTFLMIITLAYKYIFILSRTIEETYFALKSRLICNIKNNEMRKLVSGQIFFIFKKSMTNYENTYCAMISRGYCGKIKLHSQVNFKFKDFIALIIIVGFGISIILI